MIKRYMQSAVSMKYVFILPGLALGVFVFAFLYTSSGNQMMRTIGMCFGAVLAIVMILYYREKISLSLQLKKVTDLKAFDQAVMIGMAFFLEDRMLAYSKGKVFDLTYPDITRVTFEEAGNGKMYLNLETEKGVLPVEMALKDQAARVAQFLKTKNGEIETEGIVPSGDGTLRSIDPYRNGR